MARTAISLLLMLAACLPLSQCLEERGRSGASPAVCSVGSRFQVSLDTVSAAVVVNGLASDGATWVPVWQSMPSRAPFVSAIPVSLSVTSADGMFNVKTESPSPQCAAGTTLQTVSLASCTATAAVFTGSLGWGSAGCTAGNVTYTLAFAIAQESTGQLLVNLDVGPETFGGDVALTLAMESTPDEAIHGMGEQYSVWDLKGRVAPVIVSEQGVGRGVQPLTDILNTFHDGSGGNWHTTYCPIPHFITSRMRSFALENTEYSVFDFSSSNSTIVTVYSSSVAARVFIGTTPAEHVEEYTLFAGRMPPLPDWIVEGPVLGFEGGTDAVLNISATLKALNITVAGIWVQDWSGLRVDHAFGKRLWWNWEVDDVLYHDWDALCETVAQDGIRMMTYINPFLASTVSAEKPNYHHDYFKEAAALGYLVKNSTGDPYILYSTTKDFTFGTIDLTNPDAMAWYINIMKTNMIGRNQYGWMSDFAEYLPFDAVLSQGAPSRVHNDFPRLWAQANRLAVTNGSTLLPVVFFSRSGFTGSPRESTLFWDGDQLVTWDNFDGIQTTVTVRLSAGLSGFSLAHSDVGGYTMVDEYGVTYLRNKELLLRWMETSALGDAIFRSHPGNKPDQSWQVYTDNSTLVCYARMTTLHRLLAPYRKRLMADAWEHGWPLVRSLWFAYPSDPAAAGISDQYMLGPDAIAAPVMAPGVTSRPLYLPQGLWTFLWDGQTYGSSDRGTTLTLQAPIGKPIVLFASGSQVAQEVFSQISTLDKWSCEL